MKLGRNAPCPCGSRKKYKHCCGANAHPQDSSEGFNAALALSLALGHQLAGRFKDAEAVYRQVLRREPENPTALHRLGWLAHVGGDDERALLLIRQALGLAPSDWSMHYNVGRILTGRSAFNEAAASFQRAALLNPGFASIQVDLGIALSSLGRAQEASDCFERALTAEAGNAAVFSNYLHSLNYLPRCDAARVFEQHLNYARRFARPVMPPEPRPLRRLPGARIRLGYVSGEFRDFAVAWFIEPVIANHDRGAFDVFCYSNHEVVDNVTRRLQSNAEHWRSIAAMPDEQAAQLVRRDGIDILIDLSGHTRGNRLTMFALKPAPIQTSWLGYFNTTGLAAIDYLISDPMSSPPNDAQPFTETVLRLPSVRLCYAPPSYAPDVAMLPARGAGCVTFGTFNKLAKINDSVIGLWATIMNRVPRSRLLLKAHAFNETATCERFRELFAAHGVGAERLLLRPNSPHAEMLAEYGDMDIALDPFPFTGGLTTCEALWQGVPVLTLRGETLVARQSSSILAAIGLADWMAEGPGDYAEKATRFARDTDGLARLRASLRRRMACSPVCRAATFTRDLEHLYRGMWERWREVAGETA